MLNWRHALEAEIRYLKLFFPMVIEIVSVMLTSMITTYYSAKIGEETIVTGVGIATLLNIGVLYGFMLGYGTVFDSYVGAIKATYGDKALGGLVTKCALQGLIIYLVSLVPYFCCGYLVTLFGDDENVHRAAVLYLKLESARPILLYIRDLLVKYLVVQGFTLSSLLISLLALPGHFFMGWLCVVHFKWGLYGLAAAQIGNSTFIVVLLVLFCLWKREQLEWETDHDTILTGWGEMVTSGCFTGIRVTATYGLLISSHILSQSSGDDTAEAVVIIDKLTLPFLSSIFAGGYVIAILTGDGLANGDKTAYFYSIKLGLVNLVLERTFSLVIYELSTIPLASLVTGNDDVLKEIVDAGLAVRAMLALAALDEFLARGILTPLAKQAYLGITSTVSIYVVGIPLMACLIFTRRVRAASIFWCFVVSNVIQCISYLVRIYFVDFEVEVEKCADRSSNQQAKSADSSLLANGQTETNNYVNPVLQNNSFE